MALDALASALSKHKIKHRVVAGNAAARLPDGFTDPRKLAGVALFRPTMSPELAAVVTCIPKLGRPNIHGKPGDAQKNLVIRTVFGLLGNDKRKYKALAVEVEDLRNRYVTFYNKAVKDFAAESGIKHLEPESELGEAYSYLKSNIRSLNFLHATLEAVVRKGDIHAPKEATVKHFAGKEKRELEDKKKRGEATAGDDIADVRRVRDNKLVKSLRDEISNDKLNDHAGAFIKELVRIASEEQARSGEACYIYWRNAKYLPDFRNQSLKSAGTATRRFAQTY